MTYEGRRANLLDACLGGLDAVGPVVGWIRDARDRVLLALDAPLGWPKPLATALKDHRAGRLLPGRSDNLFRRETDRYVHVKLQKRPLDVAADRIARTAHWALGYLDVLRTEAGVDIDLAWPWESPQAISAIEVYPAGTLVAHGISAIRYKRATDMKARRLILEGLPRLASIEQHRPQLLADANVLDAVICVWAGIDFLEGRAQPPANQELAIREGWIWVSRPCGRSEEVEV